MSPLKGVAEAIEHCTWTQVLFSVVTAIYALEMAASARARLTFRIGLCRTSKIYGKLPRCDHGSLSTVSIYSTLFRIAQSMQTVVGGVDRSAC
jgi:hypothetical protein